jgi:hypothetical protein
VRSLKIKSPTMAKNSLSPTNEKILAMQRLKRLARQKSKFLFMHLRKIQQPAKIQLQLNI